MSAVGRLVMVVHGPYPADPRVAREARAAVAAGFDVDVVATRASGEPRREVVDGVGIYRLPVSRRRGSGPLRFFGEYVLFALLATLRVGRLSLRRRAAVVQVHNPPDFLIAAALVPKLLGARVVLDVHDLSSDMFSMRFGESAAARLAQRLLQWLERAATRVADVVVTVHEPYRAELATRGVDAERILVVMNSLDESSVPPDLPPPAREPFRIVYHGTVTPHYGLEVVLDAFALLPADLDARLEILGGGDAVPALVARAQSLGVDDRVELTGRPLAHDEVLRRVAGASVGVIPNLPTRLNRYALSTKLFEYVALGIPVAASELPTLCAHFTPDEVTFFTAGSAAALARALAGLAGDYDRALEHARAARERYDREYAWSRQAARYREMLGTLVETGGWRA